VKLVKEMEQQLTIGVDDDSGGGGSSAAAAAAATTADATADDEKAAEGNGSSDGHGTAGAAAASSLNNTNALSALPRLLTALPLQPFAILAESRLFACSTAIAICAQVIIVKVVDYGVGCWLLTAGLVSFFFRLIRTTNWYFRSFVRSFAHSYACFVSISNRCTFIIITPPTTSYSIATEIIFN